jgi:hypothetical protein
MSMAERQRGLTPRRTTMPAEPNYDNVTRVEIIGPGGQVFSYFCEPGVALDVQDDGRTLKVFVGEEVPWRTAMQRADQTQEGDQSEECPHPDWSFDRTICVGCDSMPDICVECGWHDCRPQRAGDQERQP